MLEHGAVPGKVIQTFRSAPKGIHVRPTASPSTDPVSTTVYPYVAFGANEAANIAFGTSAFGSPPTLAWNDLSYKPYGVYTDIFSGDVYAANGNDLVFYWPAGQGQPNVLNDCTNPVPGKFCNPYYLQSAYGVAVGAAIWVADGGEPLDPIATPPKPAVVRYTLYDDDFNSLQGRNDGGPIASQKFSFVETIVDGYWLRPYAVLTENVNGDVWVADAGNVSTTACNGFIAQLPLLQNDFPAQRTLNPYRPPILRPPVLIGSGWSSPRGLWVTVLGDLYVADAGCGSIVPSFLAKVPAAVYRANSSFAVTSDMKIVTVPVAGLATIAGIAADPTC